MRNLVFTVILVGLASGCATTYRSGRTTKYQPFYAVSVSFYKEDAPADSMDHRFILEALNGNRVTYSTQCDRGKPDSEFVECFFTTNNPEMSFDIRQVWENVGSENSDNQLHIGKNVPSMNEYLCATNVKVGIAANELRLNNDGSLDPEYTFNLPSDFHQPACQYHITARTMVDAMTTQANK